MRDKVEIKLSDDTATQLATRPIQYETGYTLLPGNYVIKVLARDAMTGRIGTYQSPFTVPNLIARSCGFPISTVVLSSQRVPIGDALHSVTEWRSAVNPLVYDGEKLIPSVTRVFSRTASCTCSCRRTSAVRRPCGRWSRSSRSSAATTRSSRLSRSR